MNDEYHQHILDEILVRDNLNYDEFVDSQYPSDEDDG